MTELMIDEIIAKLDTPQIIALQKRLLEELELRIMEETKER